MAPRIKYTLCYAQSDRTVESADVVSIRKDHDFTKLRTDHGLRNRFMAAPESLEISLRGYTARFKVHSIDDLISLFWLATDIFEDDEYFDGVDAKGKVVVDAGANVGMTSIRFALEGAERVHSFEPVAGTCGFLRDNIAINRLEKKVTVHELALGDADTTAEIHFNWAGDGCASLTLEPGAAATQTIHIVKLDDVIKGRVDIIKIDTEGYDAEVLEGARETIRKNRPVILLSAYHKPGDKTALPKKLAEIQPGYECRLKDLGEEYFHCEYVGEARRKK